MGATAFDSFETTQQYSTMGLTISDSEIVAYKNALLLSRVLSAYVTNSHLGLVQPTAGASVVSIGDSQDVKLITCTISGQYNNQIGVAVTRSCYPTQFNAIDECFFVGLNLAILYNYAVSGNTASGIRVSTGGPTLQNVSFVSDRSQNTSNNAQWLNASGQVMSIR
jgi:hypothetical protein